MIENMHPVCWEVISRPERFTVDPGECLPLFQKAFDFVKQRVDEGISTFYQPMEFPTPSSTGLFYDAVEHYEWTNSFWTGMVWLCYEMTGHEKYKGFAQREVHTYFATRMKEKRNVDNHDIGFLYILSAKPAWMLDGDRQALELVEQAAEILQKRFLDPPGILQAVGKLDDPKEQGIYIVDSVMNASLLYWMYQQTGNTIYLDTAQAHMQQVARHSVKEDASCYHKLRLRPDGQIAEKFAGQGHSLSGCWARGITWLQYGFALAYRYTGEKDYLELSEKLSAYHLNRLPEDLVSYWDLSWASGPEERDSSAAAIQACALLELAGQLGAERGSLYRNAACAIVKSLAEHYLTRAYPQANGVLLHGVYSKPTGLGVDESCIWGDYFFAEALVRILKPDWKCYW